MKIEILKGTHQVGGCITVISTENTKVVIDFGEDLEISVNRDQNISELLEKIEDASAVFITHSHGDHAGLINMIPEHIAVYMEEKSLDILKISADFGLISPISRPVETFILSKNKKPTPLVVGDIEVTPFIVDHSSYNACMFLIEAQGKRILHTGDYRSHGRKGRLFTSTLKTIGHVDCLITEGTTLTRKGHERYLSELELEKKAKEIMDRYDQVFVLSSSTNLDRIVTFYKARGHKKFVLDTFTAALTDCLDFPVSTKMSSVYRWNPIAYSNKSPEFKERFMSSSLDYGFLPNYVMFIKQSMLRDLRKLKNENLITNACIIYSMWPGYIEKEERLKTIIEAVKTIGIDFYELHTSGHADEQTMKLIDEIVTPKHTIIIHTEDRDKTKTPFRNVVDLEDGDCLNL